MKLIELKLSELVVNEELSRSGSSKQFEERLKSSIQQIGLAEPIKVALLPTGKYVVIDGTMRLKAITVLQKTDPTAFLKIPAYVMDYDRRYELRYQTDIYQDLLPSQLAELVEHLHKSEHILKTDIARYIGVSPTTLRNYTGLWRLLQRGGLFAKIVELMDVEVIPSSNPYAWLRLTAPGLRFVLEQNFSDGEKAELWIQQCVLDARRGNTVRFPIKFVEATTDALSAEYYREGEELRAVKRDLGLRRGAQPAPRVMAETDAPPTQYDEDEESRIEKRDPGLRGGAQPAPRVMAETDAPPTQYDEDEESRIEKRDPGLRGSVQPESEAYDTIDAIRYLSHVSRRSPNPLLRNVARSFKAYLQ
jgi:ParB-like nuclease family protein